MAPNFEVFLLLALPIAAAIYGARWLYRLIHETPEPTFTISEDVLRQYAGHIAMIQQELNAAMPTAEEATKALGEIARASAIIELYQENHKAAWVDDPQAAPSEWALGDDGEIVEVKR